MTVLDKWCFSLRCSSVLTVRQPDVLRLSRGSPGRHFLSRHSSVSARLIYERTNKVFTVILLFILSSMFWKGNHREESATSHRWQDSRKSLRPVKTSSQRELLSVKPQIVCVASLMCATQQREQTSAWTFRRWKWVRVVLQSFLICQADRTPFLTMHPIVLSEWFELQAFNVVNISYRKCGPPLNLS